MLPRKRPASSPPESSSCSALYAPLKRQKVLPSPASYISRLSDELYVRVVSFLDVTDILSFERVSHRCRSIAVDRQIWKSLFFDRFVRPRASTLAFRSNASPRLRYSTWSTKCLDRERIGKETQANWKGLYKLRHNWSRGSCGVSEFKITDRGRTTSAPSLVKLRDGIVYSVDAITGLRVWKLRGTMELLAEYDLYKSSRIDRSSYGTPTVLAIDEGAVGHNAVIGFEHGGFALFQLKTDKDTLSAKLVLRYVHKVGTSPITAIALLGSFVATMTRSHMFDVYHFSSQQRIGQEDAPRKLFCLRSQSAWPPLSLSLRRTDNNTISACVIYAFPLFPSGWSIGIQELRLTEDYQDSREIKVSVAGSRLATAVPGGTPGDFALGVGEPGPSHSGSPRDSRSSQQGRPQSVNYSYPYLLTGNADNTISLYFVKSTDKSLRIDPGQQLWGHTSAVSAVQVVRKGRAVSVSQLGDELRIWELEAAHDRRKNNSSVKIVPQYNDYGADPTGRNMDYTQATGLGGFDEERIVMVQDRDFADKSFVRALVVYDFT